nr:FGGY family carbohydrate kinase [Collinsella urealyticum]
MCIGVDLGTSSVKVCALGANRRVCAEVSRAYEVDAPRPGWREIDPERWWEATCNALDALVAQLRGAPVAAIGVTGQMHTLVPIAIEGSALRPALMWNDVRTASLLDEVRDRLQAADAYESLRSVSTGSAALNLFWMRRVEPELFDRLKCFLIGPDWIVYKLTGVLGTDFCEASTSSLFDTKSRTWSDAARAALGLPEEIFPQIRGSLEIAGDVVSSVHIPQELVGVPVIVGTGDNPAAAYPLGCLTEARSALSLGTSGVLMGVRHARRSGSQGSCQDSQHAADAVFTADVAQDADLPGKTVLFSPHGRHFIELVQGSIQSCGSTRAWLIERICNTKDYAAIDQDIDRVATGRGELMFFPHMSGEKTLFSDPSLRGAFFGLTPETSRADLSLAVMEGIAYGFKQLSECMGIPADTSEPVLVTGGGSKSAIWLQILVDVFGLPMQAAGSVSAGFGAALMAQQAACETTSFSLQGLGDPIEVDPEAHLRHMAAYQKYLGLIEVVRLVSG